MPAAGAGPRNSRQKITSAIAAAMLAFVCALIVGLGLYRELELRNADMRIAQNAASNLARSLLQHTEDTIELVDAALIGVAHRLETEGVTPETVGRLQSFLHLRKATLPRLRGLFVYGADGAWLATSENVSLAGRNNADRDYFHHHRLSRSAAPFVGTPVKSRSGGQWVVTISRRVNNPDGTFAGVVLGTLDVSYFAQSFAGFDVGPHGSIGLLATDGTLLARYPHDEQSVGRNFAGSPVVRSLSEAVSGVVGFRSSVDGVERVSAFHRSERVPLLVLVSRGRDDVLQEWWADATWRMTLVGALTLLLAGLGSVLIRELAQRQRLFRVIQTREADFRLLAEASSDMVSRIAFDGTLTYVSPSAARIVGWAPEKLVGTPALAGLEPEDREGLGKVVDAMREGRETEALVSYRIRHRDMGIVWLESALSVTRDAATGRIDGVVAISRDVTEHKQLEGQLSRLAILDGLTGLANRRRFDERLEALLAARDAGEEAHALLLVDVDHFKLFNDTYGHQVGDRCLQQIAQVLQSHATRPDDLAARYGGEEFALILPKTDFNGCRLVAERIRTAVEALAIPHSASATAGHVTISIGGATIDRCSDEFGSAKFIGLADQALYSAKRAGRNTERISAPVRSLFGPEPMLRAG